MILQQVSSFQPEDVQSPMLMLGCFVDWLIAGENDFVPIGCELTVSVEDVGGKQLVESGRRQ